MAAGPSTNEHELEDLGSGQGYGTTPDVGTDLHQTFADRFPGVANPRDGLTLLYRLDYKDGPYLILCLRMLYPELFAGRDELAKQLEALCAFVGCHRQVASEDNFWFTIFLQCSEWRYGTGEWRAFVGHRTEDSSEAWRRWAAEWEIVSTGVRAASHVINVQLAGVAEPMILRDQVKRQLVTLEVVMANFTRFLQDRAAIAARREEEAQKATSSIDVSMNGATLLTPMPGVARVGSASSGIFSLAVHGRARQQHSAKRQGTNYGQAFGGTGKAGRLSGLVTKAKGLIASASTPITNTWQRFRAATFSERLGHPTTVWILVLLLSLFAAAATALAVWEAGPNTSMPEIDSNFWSTLSQNVLSAAGLYCIVIPALQKVKLNAQNPSLFYGFLIASAVGTFVSTMVYMVHTRTSMVLAYVAALTQLLTTLQLIVAQSSRVKKLRVNVEDLEGEVARLRDERE